MSEMKKPMILTWKECHDTIAQTIENSGLPAFILEPMLRDILSQVQSAVNVEYEASLSFYTQQNQENVSGSVSESVSDDNDSPDIIYQTEEIDPPSSAD